MDEGKDGNLGLYFYNMDNVQSYALGRLISEDVAYRSLRPSLMRRQDVWDHDELLALLDTEQHRALMAPGGAWHRFVEVHRAERDGDIALADQLKAKAEYELNGIAAELRKCFPANTADDTETLSGTARVSLAARARALMRENDPDIVRAGLAEIADALDPETSSWEIARSAPHGAEHPA
jgi:hypothetical protein